MTETPPSDEWLLDTVDVADILGLSRQQVLREVAAGRLLYHSAVVRRCRTWRYYSVDNVREYLRDWCPHMSPAAEPRLLAKIAA